MAVTHSIDSGSAPSSPLVPWGAEAFEGTSAALRDPDRRWDLVIVGAGITGAGIARDAAMRGLSVLVLDAADVAFGTSSRSTRLIHGGVRYLEQAEIGLVFEALRERSRLYSAAPHLVTPARFVFPSYGGDRLRPWQLRVGLTIYDALNLFRGEGHEALTAEGCLALEPALRGDGLRGGVAYEDAITDDARLTLAVLQDARRQGAQVATYQPVTSITAEVGEHIVHTHAGDRVRCRQALVATGPWTGRKLLGDEGDGVLSLSKGIHIVVSNEDVRVSHPVVIQAPKQRRILFVVPWGQRTYLGTTDVPFTGDPGQSGVTPEEEQELCTLIGDRLPSARLGPDAIVSAWSGVRPLVRPPGVSADDTVELSRKHRVIETREGVLGIVGGKLTTFRAMAEEAVDTVIERLRSRSDASDFDELLPCRTAEQPLVDGPAPTAEELADPLFSDLWARHGAVARPLAARARANATLAEPLVAGLPYRWIEVEHAIAFEGVRRLGDLLRRRLPLVLTSPRQGGSVMERVATMLVEAQGGSRTDIDEELERFGDDVELETRRRPRSHG